MTATENSSVDNSQASGRAKGTDRDPCADFLRTIALTAVVLGHWLMAAVWLEDGELRAGNVLNHAKYLWPLTWVLLIVPLFFLVGGFVNSQSLERVRAADGSYRDFVRRRLGGLLPPIVPFLSVVILGAGIALAAGAPRPLTLGITILVVMPLWFLAVYVVLALLTGPMLTLHRRFGVWVCVAMAVLACGVDGLRFVVGDSWVAFPNYFLVWGLAQQLGFAYADGSLLRLRRGAHWAWAGGSFALLGAVVAWGPWPASMVGMSGERSNFAPPAIPALLLMLGQVALFLLVRPALSRWLSRPRVAGALRVASAFAMPAFLWHLPILVAVTGIALLVGVPFPAPATMAWWLSRPLWVLVLGAALVGFLLALARLRSARR